MPGSSRRLFIRVVLIAIHAESWAKVDVLLNGMRKHLAFLVWCALRFFELPSNHLTAWQNEARSCLWFWRRYAYLPRHLNRQNRHFYWSVFVNGFAEFIRLCVGERLGKTFYDLLCLPIPTHRTALHKQHGATPSRHYWHDCKQPCCIFGCFAKSNQIHGFWLGFVFGKECSLFGNGDGKPGANASRFIEKNNGKIVWRNQKVYRFLGCCCG